MAKTQFNVEQFKTEAVKPLFAVAGATELAVELARGYATEAQKSAQERFTEVQSRVSGVQARVAKVERPSAEALQAQARTRVDELKAEAKEAQARFEARVAELQKDAREFPARFEALLNEALEELNSTYVDLATRGEKFVAALRKDGVKAVTAVKPAPRKATPKPAATTAKKAPAKKTTAKKAPAKKASK
jgi:DNA repair exonuclease SbcCD ATPase subunit